MEAKLRKLKLYISKDGKIPFEEWLNNLRDFQARVKIKTRLDRLCGGNFGDVKFFGRGVYELRVHFGPGYRIYFGLADETIVLLLLGGDKKSQPWDIEKAKSYWKDYKERKDATN